MNAYVEKLAAQLENEPLAKLYEKSATHDQYKADFAEGALKPADKVSVRFFEEGAILHQVLYNTDMFVKPTDWAWQQIGSKLGGALFGEGSKTIPTQVMLSGTGHKDFAVRGAYAEFLNTLMAQRKSKNMFLRTVSDAAGDTQLRAVLSDRYAPVGNSELIRTVQASLQVQHDRFGLNYDDIKVAASQTTADDLHLTVITKGLDPNDRDSDRDMGGGWHTTPGNQPYGLGVNIRNNETGKGGISVNPTIQRGTCSNSIYITGQTRWQHRGLSAALLTDVTAAIGQALMVGHEYLQRLLDARIVEIPNFYQMLDNLSETRGWTSDTKELVTRGTEGHESLFGLVNGLSYVTSQTDDADKQFEFGKLAGDMLIDPTGLFSQAAWAKQYVTVKRQHAALAQ